MIRNMKYLLLISLLSFTCISVSYAAFTNDIAATIEFQPPHPRPGEEVTVSLANLESMFRGSEIVWRVNGEIVGELQPGETKLVIEAGPIERPTTVSASFAGTTIQNTLRSSYLDIILEPQTRTPSFYRGRAVPSSGSRLNATALLNGTSRNPDNLVFLWRLNFDVIGGGPLRGRSSISVDLPRFGERNILTVEVSEPNGPTIASRSFFIPTIEPQVLFYEFDPLLGLASRPLLDNRLVLTSNVATVRAEPFFIDSRVFNNPAILEWRINNRLTSNTNTNPYEVTVQRQFGSTATPISFRLSDTTNFSQAVRGNFTVQ